MRARKFIVRGLLIAEMLFLALIFQGQSPALAAEHSTLILEDVCGQINADTTWTEGNSPYIVTCDVHVAEGVTLTIEAGVVVKFSDWSDDLYVNGTLVAEGTSSKPITFTSINDNSVGGSTGTGDPAPGDWSSLRFTSSSEGNVLDHTVVRYGGGQSVENVWVNTTDITIRDNTIAHSSDYGIYFDNALPSTLSANTFISNTNYAVYAPLSSNADSITLSGNTASGNGVNGFGLSGSISGTVTWGWEGGDTLPFVVVHDLTVNQGASLTLTPGTVLKFDDWYDELWVYGTLIADSSTKTSLNRSANTEYDPIIFTSLKDDHVGGDTNGDGSTSSPAPDDWSSLRFTSSSTGSILNHTLVRYGGGYYVENVWVDTTNITITNNTIAHSSDYGIYFDNVLPSTLSSNTFISNTNYAVYAPLSNNADSITLSGNTASGNGVNGFGVEGSISGTLTWNWEGEDTLPFVVADDLFVNEGAALTLTPGTVLKFHDWYDDLWVHGTLIADASTSAAADMSSNKAGYDPIIFTSLKDDEVGGDTNGDGEASSPAPSDWSSLRFSSSSEGNVLDHTVVRYGGGQYIENVRVNTGGITISNNTIAHSSDYGIYFDNALPSRLISNTFISNTNYAAYAPLSNNADSITLSGNAASGNGVNGFGVEGNISGTVTWSWEGEDTLPFVVVHDLAVNMGASLTLTPGTVLKFDDGYDELWVYGTLIADASTIAAADISSNKAGYDPIIFTSLRDDEVGGDTNGDGSATSPAPGDWSSLRFTSSSTGSILNHTVVRYGGGFYIENVWVETTDITISNNTIAQSSDYGIYFDNVLPTTLSSNSFISNTNYAAYAPLTNNSDSITLSGNTAIGNGVNGFGVAGSLSGTLTWNWEGSDTLPFVVVDDLVVNQGATLTLAPGTVLKFHDWWDELWVNGTLIADGTVDEPIIFTSLRDDELGGDTNGDGSASSPAPDDWSSLRFTSSSVGSVLNHAVVRYGGGYYVENVWVDTTEITITNNIIAQSTGYGLYFDNALPPSLRFNTFISNTLYAVYAPLTNNTDSITLSGNTANGNGVNGFGVGGSISGTVIWSWEGGDTLPFVVDFDLVVNQGATLTLAPGTVLKFQDWWDELWVNGTLIADGTVDKPIIFTSLRDDELGGDTNGDGSASSPAPDDWSSLRFSSTSSGSVLEHVKVIYGGGYYNENIWVGTTDFTLRDSLVAFSSYYGLTFDGASPVVENSVIHDNLYGIFSTNGSQPVLSGNQIYSNTIYGVYNGDISGAVDARNNWWGSPSGPYHPSTNPSGTGDRITDGVSYYPWLNEFAWRAPHSSVLHGTESLKWAVFGRDTSTMTVNVYQRGEGSWEALGTDLPANGSLDWNTLALDDGYYDLRAEYIQPDSRRSELAQTAQPEATSQVLGEISRRVLVLNQANIAWHSGPITADETWTSDGTHLLADDVTINSGVQVTVQLGTVIKSVEDVGLTVKNDAILNALGTAEGPIIFTSLKDDSAAGDTNLDADLSKPGPGDWLGVTTQDTGQFNVPEFTFVRYFRVDHSGTLLGDETWSGTAVHRVTGQVIVPNGVVLTIEPGAAVKFDEAIGLTVQAGGELIALGNISQPIDFTSLRDDTIGGDTNNDGNLSSANLGDWRGINVDGGQARLDHVVMSYAAGTVSGSWDTTAAAISTRSGGTVTLDNSVIRQAFYEGIIAWGSGMMTISNTIIMGADRGVNADGSSTVHLINCTLENNRVGIYGHNGTLLIDNTIIANSIDQGVYNILNSPITIRYSNVWSESGVNYQGNISDQTGINGNVSLDPGFKDSQASNYHLGYLSPMIDSADGVIAPETDFMGAPRYDDPRMENTGLPTPGGAYADMGAYEFVETAESDIDLLVIDVHGPVTATAGELATVEWTIYLSGTGTAIGPWHDTINLVTGVGTDTQVIFAAEFLVAEGISLGANQTHQVSADVRVPGSVEGDHYWQVAANSRGEVFEGRNHTNNTRLSSAVVALDLLELVVDGARLNRQFAVVGESHWFKFTPSEDQDIRVDIDLAAGEGAIELYIGRGFMPSRQHYDARNVEWNSPDVSAVVAGTTAETYYVLAYAESLSGVPSSFTTGASALDFSLTGVSPAAVGNAGPVTLQLSGGQLGVSMTYQIIDPIGQAFTATEVSLVNSALVDVTFDMAGVDSGVYDLRVSDGALTATLDNALIIEAGGGGEFWSNLSGREIIRVARAQQYEINYGNSGNGDVPGALIYIVGIPNDGELELSPEFTPPSLPEDLGGEPPLYVQTDYGLLSAPLVLFSLPPGETGQTTFTITIPSQRNFNIDLYSFEVPDSQPPQSSKNASIMSAPSRSPDYTWPPEDKQGVDFALGIAREYWNEGNFRGWFWNGACVGEADWMRQILMNESNSHPDRPLNGWTVRRITKNGEIGLGHTTVLLESPSGHFYIVDNYVYPTIVPAQKTGPNKWAIHSDFHLTVNPLTNFDHLITITGGGLSWDLFDSVEEIVTIWTPTKKHTAPVKPGGSLDPNEKTGSFGSDEHGFIAGNENLTYKIYFENVSTATLPAQKVVITDVLDSDLDLSTFELGAIGFNLVEVDVPPGLDHFDGSVYVASDPNPARVHAELDINKRTITWTLESVDEVTGGLPEDPLAGFLPPNDELHRGEGYVSFSIQPLPDLSAGTEIRNAARITFDVNKPIDTNLIVYTVDLDPPISAVSPLPEFSTSPTITLSWSGSDPGGSGIAFYEVYVFDDGVLKLWLGGITETVATFVGELNHIYGFYTIATDNVGHKETPPADADATTLVVEEIEYLVFLPIIVRNMNSGVHHHPSPNLSPQGRGTLFLPLPHKLRGGRGPG